MCVGGTRSPCCGISSMISPWTIPPRPQQPPPGASAARAPDVAAASTGGALPCIKHRILFNKTVLSVILLVLFCVIGAIAVDWIWSFYLLPTTQVPRPPRATAAAPCEPRVHPCATVGRPMSCVPGYFEVINTHTVGFLTIPRASIKWV